MQLLGIDQKNQLTYRVMGLFYRSAALGARIAEAPSRQFHKLKHEKFHGSPKGPHRHIAQPTNPPTNQPTGGQAGGQAPRFASLGRQPLEDLRVVPPLHLLKAAPNGRLSTSGAVRCRLGLGAFGCMCWGVFFPKKAPGVGCFSKKDSSTPTVNSNSCSSFWEGVVGGGRGGRSLFFLSGSTKRFLCWEDRKPRHGQSLAAIQRSDIKPLLHHMASEVVWDTLCCPA